MSPVFGRSDHLDLVHAPNEVSNPALPQSTQYAAKSSNQQYKSHQTCNLRQRVSSKKTLWSFSQRRTRLLLCRQTFKGDLQPPGQQTSMTSS